MKRLRLYFLVLFVFLFGLAIYGYFLSLPNQTTILRKTFNKIYNIFTNIDMNHSSVSGELKFTSSKIDYVEEKGKYSEFLNLINGNDIYIKYFINKDKNAEDFNIISSYDNGEDTQFDLYYRSGTLYTNLPQLSKKNKEDIEKSFYSNLLSFVSIDSEKMMMYKLLVEETQNIIEKTDLKGTFVKKDGYNKDLYQITLILNYNRWLSFSGEFLNEIEKDTENKFLNSYINIYNYSKEQALISIKDEISKISDYLSKNTIYVVLDSYKNEIKEIEIKTNSSWIVKIIFENTGTTFKYVDGEFNSKIQFNEKNNSFIGNIVLNDIKIDIKGSLSFEYDKKMEDINFNEYKYMYGEERLNYMEYLYSKTEIKNLMYLYYLYLSN